MSYRMRRLFVLFFASLLVCSHGQAQLTLACSPLLTSSHGQARLSFDEGKPLFTLGGDIVISTPDEGVWSIATGWDGDWMTDWKHVSPTSVKQHDG